MNETLHPVEFLRVAPVVLVTLSILAIGWYIGIIASKGHIRTLKEFIEYLKNKGDK